MKSEKRMVGDYTVLCAVNIGSREIILAENEQDKNGERFLCCYGERNDIFQRYSECAVGDDYIDAALFFAERIKRDAELFRSEVEKRDIPVTVIAEADCIPDHYKNDINGKVIAINPAVLKPEYRRADRQLYLVTGGFGASANSRGSAVFCTNLYDGKPTRYERMDVMGEVKTECMPHWAVNKATVLKHIQGNKLIFEYGGKHFCPYRLFTKAEDTLDFISRHTARDNDLGLTDKPNAGDKSHYDHSAFYERSSIKTATFSFAWTTGNSTVRAKKRCLNGAAKSGKRTLMEKQRRNQAATKTMNDKEDTAMATVKKTAAEQGLQQKMKVLAKLFDAGCKTEKDLKALTLPTILKIPDVTVPDMTVITELQEQVAKNRLFSYLGGGTDEPSDTTE